MVKQWDFFISHASEDKNEIARPLAEILQSFGFRVWYDEFELKLGDSLYQSINNGLRLSEFGIVILSSSFFAKSWPQEELNGLIASEKAEGKTRILPIWHNLNHQEIAVYSPILADKKGLSTSEGIESLLRAILNAVEHKIDLPDYLPSPVRELILPGDIAKVFNEVEFLKDYQIDENEFGYIIVALTTNNIKTRASLNKLISPKIISVLQKIYSQELDRFPKPLEIVLSAPLLLSQGINKETETQIIELIKYSNEYAIKHPEFKLKMKTLSLPRLRSGKALFSVIQHSMALQFENTEPENEDEADIISEFRSNIDDWSAIISMGEGADIIHIQFDMGKWVKRLEDQGFFIYGIQKKGRLAHKENTLFDDWITTYIMVSKSDQDQMMLLIKL